MQNKFAVIAMIMIIMVGMTGLGAATYDSSVTLDNKDDCSATGACTTTPGDLIGGVVEYNFAGDEFEWSATGTVPATKAGYDYVLIYYADEDGDWGGDNPGALIGTITTDSNGDFDASGSNNIDMDLPCSPDTNMNDGAKIWMVPSADYAQPMTVWNPTTYLFEIDLITYVDCDLYDTAPPANATFAIEDALVGEPINIMITNATNVGAVDIILYYNDSLAAPSVTNGEMDATVVNTAVSGQVTIGAYQTGSTEINGDFTLVGLDFAAIGDVEYEFEIEVTTYKDATPCGRTMPYDFADDYGRTYLNGDVNGDGVVDMFDVMYLAKHDFNIPGFEVIIEVASDVNDDGFITLEDATYLALHIVGASGWEVLH